MTDFTPAPHNQRRSTVTNRDPPPSPAAPDPTAAHHPPT